MLAKKYRLTKNKQFNEVMSKGKSGYSPYLMIKVISNDYEYSRYGIIVSNKVSKKASQRNLIKRRVREILKKYFSSLASGKDVVIVISPKIINDQNKVLSFEQIEENLIKVFKKTQLL